MTAEILIGLVLCAAFGYLALERWLIASTDPVRDELLEVSESLLGSPKYPDVQKDMISVLLDEAMDWNYMVGMVMAYPRLLWRAMRSDESPSILDDFVLDKDFRHFVSLHSRSVTAINPLFTLIFRVEVAISAILLGTFAISTFLITSTSAFVAERMRKNKIENTDQGAVA